MTSTASTNTDDLSSASALPLGRRVGLYSGFANGETLGAIVRVNPLSYDVRHELTGEITVEHAGDVRPVTVDPSRCAGDPIAEMAAAHWVAKSRGQLDALAGDYNSAVYQALTEAGRDICRTIDEARAVQRPCRYTWTIPANGNPTEATSYGCVFTAEPNSRACGVHLPVVERTGEFGPTPFGETVKVAPVGVHDPRRMLALDSWNAPLPDGV